MAKIHNLGFPRIGAKRELKHLLESLWRGDINETTFNEKSNELWLSNLQQQATLDHVPVGDFSFYDHVLDTSFLFGNLPQRITEQAVSDLDKYFLFARGKAGQDLCCENAAGEMTKWFDTNYHYIVPEINKNTQFSLHPKQLLQRIKTARGQGYEVKPVLVGPLTYLYLSRSTDETSLLDKLPDLLTQYVLLLTSLGGAGIEWVQLDEPILSTNISSEWSMAFRYAYQRLSDTPVKVLLANYFGKLNENLSLVTELPVEGLHVDGLQGEEEVAHLANHIQDNQVLSVGVVNGRNIWKQDLRKVLRQLQPLQQKLENRLWLAPTCSLLHVPVDVTSEDQLTDGLANRLSFAVQKIKELEILREGLNRGEAAVEDALTASDAIAEQAGTKLAYNPLLDNDEPCLHRSTPFDERYAAQQSKLKLPLLPTTTIGSFPQTQDIRKVRAQYRHGDLDEAQYKEFIEAQIKLCIKQQVNLGLDVLVHGEAERNDMVEYFGELLEGIAVSRFGWVQSYGSRCVKPPIIHGDITRPVPMTVEWLAYAQSLTDKPVKGMLTGPVTIINWSFVRDDIPQSDVAYQLANALRDEIADLETAGIKIVQVDEAALREGLPLRQEHKEAYLQWAVNAFKLATSSVSAETQIHTHMCYSEFSDIIDAIARMDADVVTIETARSHLTLLDAFKCTAYPNAIGPGVYDIHSPACPATETIGNLIETLVDILPVEKLWINPDCGLKTRQWSEVLPALSNMVSATELWRQKLTQTA
ncbi:5-methyltetrahydropteroyltriglutamate--homocysteine S-methyltransferase [Alteromonas sp. C1M14]|uniref:5-methyltetrahydropteroyltriglutamate-- homocysteine S-methyltransferase n=1 Tax=Alteromonas sp. C1M14 TaxID=2841567 RepID=UPI001C082A27|nr:5-methyltetrahydropteroyltriglutamate--homocysteine S-methyltransferase [Alteromonas sp. C1M14]MBU2977994.1 5-methyltetrahydropteroyltriglutamate--homocysteine S-methyltransferase [Alteromonas sp. C1M14]